MIDPTTLEALAGRVERGEHGREMDARIGLALDGEEDEIVSITAQARHHPEFGDSWTDVDGHFRRSDGEEYGHTLNYMPPLTSSLDAIEAARVRLLPESRAPDIEWDGRECTAFQFSEGGGYHTGISDTERDARLAALLRAVAAKVRAEAQPA